MNLRADSVRLKLTQYQLGNVASRKARDAVVRPPRCSNPWPCKMMNEVAMLTKKGVSRNCSTNTGISRVGTTDVMVLQTDSTCDSYGFGIRLHCGSVFHRQDSSKIAGLRIYKS